MYIQIELDLIFSPNLNGDVDNSDGVERDRLQQEDQLDGEPGDGEHEADHRHQLHHPPLVVDALPAGGDGPGGLRRRQNLSQSSNLIGRGPTRLGSHWSRASQCCLPQQSYAIKNQLVALFFCLLLAGSLWYKDSWLP